MRNTLLTLLLVCLTCLTSCSLIHSKPTVVGKATKKEQHLKSELDYQDEKLSEVAQSQLSTIGVYSFGVTYALNRDTNQDPYVKAGIELNERVAALANKVSLDDQKAMTSLTDQLITNAVNGVKLLQEKDSTITELSARLDAVTIAKQKVVKDFIALSDKQAQQEDSLSAQLASYQGWFGLKAVFKGLFQFVRDSALFLSVFGVIFLVLRYLSFYNPICAEVFSIFSKIGSWVIQVVEWIVPKSLNELELVSASAYNSLKADYQNLLASATPPPTPTTPIVITGSAGASAKPS